MNGPGEAPAAPENPELAAFVARLDAGGEGAEPGVTGQAAGGPGPSLDSLSAADAALVARLGVDWIAAAVIHQYPVLDYPDATRARCAELAGAVMAKHDLFAWMKRWKEEFALGAFLAGVGWQSYKLVQASRRGPAAAPGDGAAPAAPGPVSPAA